MKIAVIGGGKWGTAMAVQIGNTSPKYSILIYERRQSEYRNKPLAQSMNETRFNKKYLRHVPLPDSVTASFRIDEVVKNADVVFIAYPFKFYRDISEKLSPHLKKSAHVVNLTKALGYNEEEKKLVTPVDIFYQKTGHNKEKIGCLVGPTVAQELAWNYSRWAKVIRKVKKIKSRLLSLTKEEENGELPYVYSVKHGPTKAIVAFPNESDAELIKKLCSNEFLMIDTNTKVRTYELLAGLKNFVAIFEGVSKGVGYGDNTSGTMMSPALIEMAYLVKYYGGDFKQVLSVAGVGDLYTTMRGGRNGLFGYNVGKGKKDEFLQENKDMIIEGIPTTEAVHKFVEEKKLPLRIPKTLYEIIHENKDPKVGIFEILNDKGHYMNLLKSL